MNPVERQLVLLRERWDVFRDDPSCRLLIWQLPENAMRFAQCFFEAQQHDAPYAAGDLFIVFDTPFDNSIQYSRDLKETLAKRYEASRDELQREGIEPNWKFAPDDVPDSAEGFIESLCSFSIHHPIVGHVAAVLLPRSVSSVSAWTACLQRMLTSGMPESVRCVLLDPLDDGRLHALTGNMHPLIKVDTVHMDAWSTAQETFAQEPASGPAGVFRSLLTSLFVLVERGSADQVMLKAADALAFARQQQWPEQEVVVRMLAAGSMLKEKRFADAVNHYRHAREAATKLAARNPSASSPLVLQSWFGEAGAHFCAGDLIEAARCYDAATPVAKNVPSVLLWIESLRMSAQSHLQAGRREIALDRSLQVLTVGSQLPAEQRLASTLPIACVELLRLIEPERVKTLESIKHQLDEDQARLLRTMEQRVAEHDARVDSSSLRKLEKMHEEHMERLVQNAKRNQHKIASTGSERFEAVYRETNELLGPGWLIDSPCAILPKAGVAGTVTRGTV